MKARARNVGRVLRQSGVLGLCRTAARVALADVRDRAAVLQAALLHAEGRARIPTAERTLARRNARLRDLHAGKRCFIVGTGPSLTNYDLTLLAGETVIGVNGLLRHPAIETFRPRYYCLMDWAFFDDHDASDIFFQKLRGLTPDCSYFVPSRFHEVIMGRSWLPAERTYYVPTDGSFADATTSTVDIADFLPATPNAVQFAIANAVYLGFSEIYIIGADHDWLTKRYGGPPEWDKHFYEGGAIDRPVRPEDIDPFGTYLGAMGYCTILWRGYQNLRAAAARKGQSIYIHPESYIDVFPRFDYPKVLSAPGGRSSTVPQSS